ncbi:hypothetical protein HWV62_29672 [Athelia sp. TMB]|nr:hypothetical protein HWV62_29672 [Athelia sp. TMB]
MSSSKKKQNVVESGKPKALDVRVGTGGLQNLVQHQRVNKAHLKKVAEIEAAAKAKALGLPAPKKKTATFLTRFFPKASTLPATSSSSHLPTPSMLSNTSAINLDTPPVPGEAQPSLSRNTPSPIDIDSFSVTSPSPPPVLQVTASSISEPAHKILAQLCALSSSLPTSVAIGVPGDVFAAFNSDPRDSLQPGEDAWEHAVDPMLNRAIGFGKLTPQIASEIRRGDWGMGGFCRWIEICLKEIPSIAKAPGMLETRLERVCSALRFLGATDTPPDPLYASTDIPTPTPVHPQAKTSQKLRRQCHGQPLDIGDRSPWMAYPFGLHGKLTLPWKVVLSAEELLLVSDRCAETVKNGEVVCMPCSDLLQDNVVRGIVERLESGPHENIRWDYLNITNLVDLLERKNRQINSLKLDSLNLQRSLLVQARHLEGFKRLLFAVAKGDIPRLHSLVDTMLANGSGIFAILEKIDLACRQVYNPKSYTEIDYQRLFLFHKLGGVAVAELAHRTLGLPSIEATRLHIRTQPLILSTKYPTSMEMASNLAISFPASHQDHTPPADSPGSGLIGFQLMADEIKIESRLRWHAGTNSVESTTSAMSWSSEVCQSQIVCCKESMMTKFTLLPRYATVLAVSHYSDAPRAYSAHPFVVSGSCKLETVAQQQQLLDTARQVLVQQSSNIGGRLYSITSDGDARRRLATARITMTQTVNPNSALYGKLGNGGLRLFNYSCGADEITADIEYKHLFKRIRNSLLRSKGVQINGTVINSAVLRRHLTAAGRLEDHRIRALLSPDHKQDVKLAYDLLSAIAVLPPANPEDAPPTHTARRHLRLLGNVYSHLLEAYTNINLSITQQLFHLAAAGHLLMAIYKNDKGNCMPSQTYFDWMVTIKNAYFCVAKTQVDNPAGKFWIILIGTDPLEKLFEKVRTVQGNDCNTDAMQLANRVESAAICTQILAEHPEWERGPRRLLLKTWRDDAGDVSSKIDHISPAQWKGNVYVNQVSLLTCWEGGRAIAETELAAAQYPIPFVTMDAGEGYDMLCLFGNHRMVLVDGISEGEREEDDDEMDICASISEAEAESPSDCETAPALQADDLQELAAEQLGTADSGNIQRSGFVTITNTQTGKSFTQHKSSVCRLYSTPITVLESQTRLQRVRGYSRHDNQSKPERRAGMEIGEAAEPAIHVEDPACLLVRTKDLIWLAITQIVAIKEHGAQIDQLPVRLVAEPHVRFTVRIMQLNARVAEDNEGDWESTGRCDTGSHEVDGQHLQLINPTVLPPTRAGQTMPYYSMHSAELINIACLMFGRLQSQADRFPEVRWTDTFPYRAPNGSVCFICEDEDTPHGSIQSQHRCTLCPLVVLGVKPPAKLVEHMSMHILHDPKVKNTREPCGFCTTPDNACSVRLRKGKGSASKHQIDLDKSSCVRGNMVKLSLSSAIKQHSRCTNIPMHCPVCPPGAAAVWKYNFPSHFAHVHPTASIEEHNIDFAIDKTESVNLKTEWRRPNRISARTVRNLGEVTISESHSARLALRTTDLADAPTRSPELEEHSGTIQEAPEDLDENTLSLDESFGTCKANSGPTYRLVPPSESSESCPPSPDISSADLIPAISDDDVYDHDTVELPASSAASDSGRESIPSDTEPDTAVVIINDIRKKAFGW